ncbi:hypothetical protein DL767_011096 [Monosporascus sp. MG133]|nr:hypothetical protein DL767_011096 [Monosporascus sp. MG133]
MVVPVDRRQHVLLEHLATAVTGCVLAKDELETLVDDLGLAYSDNGVTGVFDRAKWIRKEDEIRTLLQRLQNHKSSLNLILTIFQCNSSSKIQESLTRLCSLVEEAVSSSSALSVRISRLEGNRTIGHGDSELASLGDGDAAEGDDATIRAPGKAIGDQPRSSQELRTVTFTFDETLQNSRAYQKLQLIGPDAHSETSITSSARQRITPAIFSALSIGDISNLSQYSLPIFIQEISNNQWYRVIHLPNTNIPEPKSSDVVIRAVIAADFLRSLAKAGYTYQSRARTEYFLGKLTELTDILRVIEKHPQLQTESLRMLLVRVMVITDDIIDLLRQAYTRVTRVRLGPLGRTIHALTIARLYKLINEKFAELDKERITLTLTQHPEREHPDIIGSTRIALIYAGPSWDRAIQDSDSDKQQQRGEQ